MEKLRLVPCREKRQRGCQYCKDMEYEKVKGGLRTGCPHEECPYHVLDNYKTYEDYMESDDCKLLVEQFFQTGKGLHHMVNNGGLPKRIFSDADDRVVL